MCNILTKIKSRFKGKILVKFFLLGSWAAAIKFWDKRLTGVGKDALFAWYKKKFGLELNTSTWKTWWHKWVELLQQAENLSVDDAKATKRIKAYGPIDKLNNALFK